VRSIQERFEAKVDRRGHHHRWLGTTDDDGTPQMKVNGRLTTARRVAWQLTGRPLSPGVTVSACAQDPTCVRVEHLGLGRRRRPAPLLATAVSRQRSRRGTGSLREIRPGVWELAVTAADGSRRRFRRIEGDRDDAAAALASFAVEAGGQPSTLEALTLAYLAHLEAAGRSPSTLRRYHQLWRDWLAPELAQTEPNALTRASIERTLRHMAAGGQSPSSVHQAAVVVSGCLAWAHTQDHLRRNPSLALRLPDQTRLAPPRRR
jgi:hypothetical protein